MFTAPSVLFAVFKTIIGWGFYEREREIALSKFKARLDYGQYIRNCIQIVYRAWLFWISQKPNLITVLLYIQRKNKWKSCVCFFSDCKRDKARELDMISLRNHTLWSYIHDMTTCDLGCPRHDYWFRKFTVLFRTIRKEIVSSMYSKPNY